MERRKGLFDEDEKEEEEVPYGTTAPKEEKVEVMIPPEEEKREESKAGGEPEELSKGFHEVGLAERPGNTNIISSIEDELNLDFMVGNPEERGGHI